MADHGDDDVDGCLCDISLEASEIVSDRELPPASGGVQIKLGTDALGAPDDADDAPDIGDVTTDEELPPATGGVA